LILPYNRAMSLDLLRKIGDLVDQGMCLVVTGPQPEGTPGLTAYPASDVELRKVAGELWGDLDGTARTERTVGKGRVFWGLPLRAVLDKLAAKADFEFTSASGTAVINYTHRRAAATDLYFVANRWHQTEDLICTFNVQGKCPEIWNAETGQMSPVAIYDEMEGRTRVPMRLDPSGSVFVVFRSPQQGRPVQAIAKDGAPVLSTEAFAEASKNRPRPKSPNAFGPVFSGSGGMKGEAMPMPASEEPPAVERAGGATGELLAWQNGVYSWESGSQSRQVRISEITPPVEVAGPWRVRFAPNLGAPPEVTLDRLISWTDHPDKGVKYFSGTATYVKQINVTADALTGGKRLHLDLGRVEVLAEVLIGGKSLGILWKPPFRVNITDAVHPGDNDLEIRVTNLWPNRLIGDEQLPPENEYTQTFSAGGYSSVGIKALPDWYLEGKPKPPGGRITFTTWKHYSADSPLLESGLIGPVRLRTAVMLPIDR
jgi:hypothetical protein